MTYTVQHLVDESADRWQSVTTIPPIVDRLAAIMFGADSSARVGGCWRVIDSNAGLCWLGTGLSGRDRVELPREDAKTLVAGAVDLALELAGKLVRLQAVVS